MDRRQVRRPSRRGFLGTGMAALAGGCIASAAPARVCQAIEPLRRPSAKFKFSLAAYSYRKLLQGKPPALTLYDFVDDCAALQLEGTELTSYYFPPNVDTDYLYQLKRYCFQLGLDVSGTAVGNDFGHADGEQRTGEIAKVKQWVDRAAILGAPVIRIFAGHVHGDESSDEVHSRMVSAIEECCQYAGEHGVHLALENHGGPTATADGLLRFVNDVQSPWFGVNVDTGNFHSDDVYGDLERIAPYALNVQVKVVISGTDGRQQPTDYRRLAEIFRQANYRGYIVLEYEENEEPRQACRQHMEALRLGFLST